MGTDIMNLDRMFSEIKVPSKPHIANEQQPVTHEELENRMRIAKELESIGISTSKFDSENGHEDADVMQAIILVNQGKRVPEDLRKRLLKKTEKTRRNILRVNKN